MNLFDTGMTTGAAFSPCRKWRYELHRIWHDESNLAAFIGLNPSTADETEDDPTIRRCIGYAKKWGHSGLVMLNLFAFRATDPKDMKAAPDPIGPENDEHLFRWTGKCKRTVAAWGAHGTFNNRAAEVFHLLDKPLECLKVLSSGQPGHPLYLKSDLEPIPWTLP